MRRFAEHLGRLGSVRAFDYPYMQAGSRRRAPDKQDVLVAAHRAELTRLARESATGDKLVLAGKSMGSRMGCHVAVECAAEADARRPDGLVCFGYPLRGQNGKLRDQVLLALTTPILFVQGTRDEMCPLPELAHVRQRMQAPSELFVVQDGDHSLEATKTALKARGTTQPQVEEQIVEAVRRFCASLGA
jgi:predicted alpha/beta-hydrolase family hydrolase